MIPSLLTTWLGGSAHLSRTLQAVATITVVAGTKIGLAEPALLAAWLTLGNFLGASLG